MWPHMIPVNLEEISPSTLEPAGCHGAWLGAGSGPGKAGAATGWCLAVPNHGHHSSCSKGSSPLVLNTSMNLWHCFPSDRPVSLFPRLTPVFIKVLFFSCPVLGGFWTIRDTSSFPCIKSYIKSCVIVYGKLTSTIYIYFLVYVLILYGNRMAMAFQYTSLIETVQIYSLIDIDVIILRSYLQWNPISKWISLVFEQHVWWFAFFSQLVFSFRKFMPEGMKKKISLVFYQLRQK